MPKKNLTTLQKKILDCVSQGMDTKEIVLKLDCSKSSVKHIRNDKTILSMYTNACRESIREIVPNAIKELGKIIIDPKATNNEKISASKQILELSKIKDMEVTPQEDIKVKISYVTPEERQAEKIKFQEQELMRQEEKEQKALE